MRYSGTEETILVGIFKPNSTVTIKILDIAHDDEIPLVTNVCYESDILPGVYMWSTLNIDASRIDEYNNLLYEMKDNDGNVYYGKFIIGGYVDKEIDLSAIQDPAAHDAILRILKIINARLP